MSNFNIGKNSNAQIVSVEIPKSNNGIQTNLLKKQAPVDTFELSTKQKAQPQKGIMGRIWDSAVKSVTPDRHNQETVVIGIDGYEPDKSAREEIRERILSNAGLRDKEYAVVQMDSPQGEYQIKKGSKYYGLGVPRFNAKTKSYIYDYENLREMPDANGVRGKTPLSGKNEKGIFLRLKKMHDQGVKTVIDLRTAGECSSRARKVIDKIGMEYVNFPVDDMSWTTEDLDNITRYIKAVNSGDFYVGCANGQARTDLAVSINYVLNPKSKNIPQLYFGTAKTGRVSVNTNLKKILSLVEKRPEIVKEWGYENFEAFAKASSKKLKQLLSSIS